MLIDTHCHIHSADYPLDREEVLKRAIEADVTKMICIATSDEDEKLARAFAVKHPEHIFYRGWERGLDYHDEASAGQGPTLISYLEKHQKDPQIFHVRDAFSDFLNILDQFPGVKGVIHSYSGNPKDTERALKHKDIYFGISALAIFTKIKLTMPLNRILLETDAPYLTPPPNRGKVNEPANVAHIAEWVASQLDISVSEVAEKTTQNAERLFHI